MKSWAWRENGQRLALMLEDPQNGWYQVQYNGQTAFVSADYAEVVEVTLEEYNQLRGTSSGTDTTSDTSAAATPTPCAGRHLLNRYTYTPILWTQRTANNAVLFFLPGGP